MSELNKYSKTFTQDPTQPAAQAMLYGIGLTDADMAKHKSVLRVWVTMVTPATCTLTTLQKTLKPASGKMI